MDYTDDTCHLNSFNFYFAENKPFINAGSSNINFIKYSIKILL